MEVAEEVSAGEAVRVTLHAHDDSTHISLGAEVRWHVASGDAHELGLRFTGSTAEVARQMFGFAASAPG